jgi:hypothetical protein
MKRGALVFAVVAVLLLADGCYLQVSNNQVGGDTGVLFGNPNLFLSAGTVVLISGGFLLLGAAIMWAVAMRRGGRPAAGRGPVGQPQISQSQVSQPPASEARTEAGAERAEMRKGQGHQRQP